STELLARSLLAPFSTKMEMLRSMIAPSITKAEILRSLLVPLSGSALAQEKGNAIDEDDTRGDVKSDQVNAVSDDQTTELNGTP
ncbi:unnamed protein product, partial [marine sediment metagenome]